MVKSYLYRELNYIVQKRTPSTRSNLASCPDRSRESVDDPRSHCQGPVWQASAIAPPRVLPVPVHNVQCLRRSSGSSLQVRTSVRRDAPAVGAMAVSLAFLSTGVAAADDYAGQTYSDASKAISDAGKKVVIASRAGDTPADDDCIVTHSAVGAVDQGRRSSRAVTDTVLVYLNCNAKVAWRRQGSGQLGGQPGGQGGHGGARSREAARQSGSSGAIACTLAFPPPAPLTVG